MGSNPIIVTQIYHYGGMNTQQSKKLPPNKVGIWVQIPLVVQMLQWCNWRDTIVSKTITLIRCGFESHLKHKKCEYGGMRDTSVLGTDAK